MSGFFFVPGLGATEFPPQSVTIVEVEVDGLENELVINSVQDSIDWAHLLPAAHRDALLEGLYAAFMRGGQCFRLVPKGTR